MNINKITKISFLIVVVMLISVKSNAQFPLVSTPAGPGSGPSSPVLPDGSVPFDGGLSIILLAAGAGLSARRNKVSPSSKGWI